MTNCDKESLLFICIFYLYIIAFTKFILIQKGGAFSFCALDDRNREGRVADCLQNLKVGKEKRNYRHSL